MSRRALWLALALCGCVAAGRASSASLRVCDRASPLTARQQDHLLRFAAMVKRELDDSGEAIALIARSGLDLQRFGIRYSHAGVSLKASDNTPWSVRQLYFACDEGRPRLFDQGLAGFLFGTDDPTIGYVSIVLLPRHEAAALDASGAGQGPRVAAAGRELQRQCLPVQPALPELQPVGDGVACHRLGRPR